MKTFAVRSNAKRHLRTHKFFHPTPVSYTPYIVDFDEPVILDSVPDSIRQSKRPLKWIPQVRSNGNNVDGANSRPSQGSGRPSLSLRLRPMLPFANGQASLGEGDSYLIAGSHSYVSSQVSSVYMTKFEVNVFFFRV